MYQPYLDFQEGLYTSVVTVTKGEDGKFTAKRDGFSATHYDQAAAVCEVQSKLRDHFLAGGVQPTAT